MCLFVWENSSSLQLNDFEKSLITWKNCVFCVWSEGKCMCPPDDTLDLYRFVCVFLGKCDVINFCVRKRMKFLHSLIKFLHNSSRNCLLELNKCLKFIHVLIWNPFFIYTLYNTCSWWRWSWVILCLHLGCYIFHYWYCSLII